MQELVGGGLSLHARFLRRWHARPELVAGAGGLPLQEPQCRLEKTRGIGIPGARAREQEAQLAVVKTVLDRIPFWLDCVNSSPILGFLFQRLDWDVHWGITGILTHGQLRND